MKKILLNGAVYPKDELEIIEHDGKVVVSIFDADDNRLNSIALSEEDTRTLIEFLQGGTL